MKQRMQELINEIDLGQISNLVRPIAILVIGWLAALLLSWGARAVLGRFRVDEQVAKRLWGGDKAKGFSSKQWISKAVYYITLIFVLIAFFQSLGLTAATEPLNAFLEKLFAFLPRLLAGAVLLFVAWLLATLLKTVLKKGLTRLEIDKRVGGDEKSLPLSEAVSDTVYWLTFLLFLPAVLGALRLQGLLVPVQGLVDKILGFIPNLFSAALLLGAGWFVAHIVQRVVSNLLASAGADRLGGRLGLERALGTWTLSSLIGLLVKVFILIPVIVGALNALQMDALTQPASRMLETLLNTVPALLGAALVLSFSYIGGRVLAKLVSNLLQGIGFDSILDKLGISQSKDGPSKSTPSRIVGGLALVGIMLFATITAANLLHFENMSNLLEDFTVLTGHVLLGLLILALGLYFANLAATALKDSQMAHANALSLAARVAVLILAGAMSLRQMGLANEIIELGFGLLLGAVAVAIGLSFGLGGRDSAGKIVEEWRQKFKQR